MIRPVILAWALLAGLVAAVAAVVLVEAGTGEPVGWYWGLAAWGASVFPNYVLLRGLTSPRAI